MKITTNLLFATLLLGSVAFAVTQRQSDEAGLKASLDALCQRVASEVMLETPKARIHEIANGWMRQIHTQYGDSFTAEEVMDLLFKLPQADLLRELNEDEMHDFVAEMLEDHK